MSPILHLRASDARLVPWKNGRGTTRELALSPLGASFERGDFDWRISAASVEEDGPFSSFPGIERVLVVTEGAGIVLDHGGAAPRARVEPLVPYRFSGEWPTRGELVAGRITDFNVLCRRGKARAEVEVWTDRDARDVRCAQGEQLFVHVLAGELAVQRLDSPPSEPRDWFLRPGESLWVREPTKLRLAASTDLAALCVRLLAEHA